MVYEAQVMNIGGTNAEQGFVAYETQLNTDQEPRRGMTKGLGRMNRNE